MRHWMWGAALSLATAGIAAAQPGPPPPAPLGPPLAPAPEAPPPPPAPAPVVVPHDESTAGRPSELAIAIGVGYALPTSLQTPNTTSVRVRLPSGLTFEPQLVFATSSRDTDTASNRQSEITLASLIRYPIRVRHRVDLEAIGDATISSRTIDPNGDNNNTTITSIGLRYGAGLAYWISPHWNLSLTATNPLFAYDRNRQETGVGAVTTTKTTTIGLVFDPQVTVMIHLYD
jgi:outer membrane protein with beta-barrel domain